MNSNPKFFNEMLTSLSTQTYKNFELIVVIDKPCNNKIQQDLIDCSILFKDKFSIKLIINKFNIGLTKSLNIACRNASGDVFVRIDADDYLCSKRLEILNVYFKKGYKFVGNSSYFINSSSKIFNYFCRSNINRKRSLSKLLKLKHLVAHSSIALTKSLFYQLDGYNENYRFSQDYDLILRALNMLDHHESIILKNKLTYVRIHQDAISSSNKRRDQIAFQLVALITYIKNLNTNDSQNYIYVKFYFEKLLNHPLWFKIEKVIEFKAKNRSRNKFQMLFLCLFNYKIMWSVINERRILLEIIKNF